MCSLPSTGMKCATGHQAAFLGHPLSPSAPNCCSHLSHFHGLHRADPQQSGEHPASAIQKAAPPGAGCQGQRSLPAPPGRFSFSRSSEINESHYNLLEHCLVSQPQCCTRSTLIMQIMQLCHSSRELHIHRQTTCYTGSFLYGEKKQAWLQSASLRPGFHGFSAGSWHECLEHTNSHSVPRNSGHQVPARRTRRGIHLVNLTPHTGISQHTQPLLCRCYISETQLWLPATIYMQSGPSSYICPHYTAAKIAAPVLTREKRDPLDLIVPY